MFFSGSAKQPWAGVVMGKEGDRDWHLVHVTSVHDHGVSFYRLVSSHEMGNWTFYESVNERAADKTRVEAAWAKEQPHSIAGFLLDMEANNIENELIGDDLLKAWHKWRVGREQATP